MASRLIRCLCEELDSSLALGTGSAISAYLSLVFARHNSAEAISRGQEIAARLSGARNGQMSRDPEGSHCKKRVA
jgi:hypothetical protein